MNLILGIGLGVFGLAIAFALIYKKMVIDKQIQTLNNLEDEVAKSKIKAKEILESAEKEAVSKGKEIELKAKERAYSLKEEAEKEIRNSKNEILQKEARLAKKEETLDHRN